MLEISKENDSKKMCKILKKLWENVNKKWCIILKENGGKI